MIAEDYTIYGLETLRLQRHLQNRDIVPYLICVCQILHVITDLCIHHFIVDLSASPVGLLVSPVMSPHLSVFKAHVNIPESEPISKELSKN